MKCLDCPNHIMRPSLRCSRCAYQKRLVDKRRQNRERRQRLQANRKPTMPRVVVHIDEDGLISYYVGSGVELFIVDEAAPSDRVYRWSGVAAPEEIERLLGGDPVGHRFDDSNAARKLGQRLN